VPGYWRAALNDATAATTPNQRIMVLPGELFGWYRWGETVTSIAPYLTPRRLTIREIDRFSDARSSQLETTIDDLVQQDRLVPGQLQPLLGLLGVGSVLVPNDGYLPGNGALDPADVAHALRDQPMFDTPAKSYGAPRIYLPMPGRDGTAVTLPAIRRYTVPGPSPGVVRVHPLAGTTVLDGDGSGIAELAADGMLNPANAVIYAGDTSRRLLTQLVGAGARLVFSDSNRRRIVSPSSVRDDVGPTLEPGDPIAADTPSYDLFPALGAAAETVSTFSGLSYLRSPGPQRSALIFPADGVAAAVDGNLNTAWLADAQSPVSQRYIQLGLRTPIAVPSIRIYPLDEGLGVTTAVAISVNGGPEKTVPLRAGWNTVPIGANPLRTLRIRIAGVIGFGSAGGISELQIPGVTVRQALRLPTDLASATRSLDLSHSDLAVLLQRTTADFPYREQSAPGDLQALSAINATDSETGIRRIVTLPAARTFSVSGWASVRAAAPDPMLDRLAGLRRGWRFSSSGRFEGIPINRASSAFDGDPNTAWVARFVNRAALPWIQWSAPRPITLRALQLTPGPARYDFPTIVRLTAPGSKPQIIRVGPGGAVDLYSQMRSRVFRLKVVAVRYAIGPVSFDRFLDAVAIAQITVPGMRPPVPRRTGSFTTACGALTVAAGSRSVRARVYGTVAALDAGEPLRIAECGRAPGLPMQAGANYVVAPAGLVMQPDHLALNSPPPDPLPLPPSPRLISAGNAAQGSQTAIRPAVAAPSWLVLGESYSSGWQAWCRDAAGREYALGQATPIDGYATGWQINSGCVSARMAFAPQSTANLAYIVSAIVAVLLLAAALGLKLPARLRAAVGRRGRARPRPAPSMPVAAVPAAVVGPRTFTVRLRWTLVWGAGAGAATGFMFALRFGVAAGVATALLLLVGVTVRGLIRLAIAGVILIVILYLVRPAPNYGGFSFYFSQHNILANWIGAAVVCAMLAAAVLQAIELRAHGGPSESQPPERERTAPGPAPHTEVR
jgi:arabinofuranan 3-O-arabinosyltransferase